jgi:membrane-bound ClpP family serine protease
MSIGLIITLILIGIVCLILEILVLPGAVIGIFGSLLIAGGVYSAYYFYGDTTGHITLAASAVATLLVLIICLRSRAWRKLSLKTQINSKMNVIDEQKIQAGAEGTTISRLAPMGKARINGEIVEVSSISGFIDVGKTVVVTQVEGNKITVNGKTSNPNL